MKTRSENRKALPKFFLTILGAGLFGGVLGFAAGFMNAGSLSDGVRQLLNAALTASAPPRSAHPKKFLFSLLTTILVNAIL